MKTRCDFVSNSSSSSFIITFNDNGMCIDQDFLHILKNCNYITVRGNCCNKAQLMQLKDQIKSEFGENCLDNAWDDANEVVLYAKAACINPSSMKQVELVKNIVALDNSYFTCSCGDDYGKDLAVAVQTATLLEYKYKSIKVDGDDHMDYCSIRGSSLDAV